LIDIERWLGPDVNGAGAKEVLAWGVSVGYVKDDSLVAIIGKSFGGMSDNEACQPLFLV